MIQHSMLLSSVFRDFDTATASTPPNVFVETLIKLDSRNVWSFLARLGVGLLAFGGSAVKATTISHRGNSLNVVT